jgi:hypothetical protein
MNILKISIIQILFLVIVSLGALMSGDKITSCIAGLYAIPYVLMVISFAPEIIENEKY